MVRIGVTGHRVFDVVEAVSRAVDAALARLGARGPIEVWSALAEGADRLVAERAMAAGASLVALLPLAADDYRTDFDAPGSAAEFDRLLAAATEVRIATPADASREAAYEAAGFEMLDAVDVVIAIWDGAPALGRGGTAEVVAEARRRGTDVVVVPVTRDNVVL